MKIGISKSAKETCRNQSLEINHILKRPGQENLSLENTEFVNLKRLRKNDQLCKETDLIILETLAWANGYGRCSTLEVHKRNGLSGHRRHIRNKLASHPLTNLPYDLLRLHVKLSTLITPLNYKDHQPKILTK